MRNFLLIILIFSSVSEAKTLYIKSVKAPVLGAAKMGGAPLFTLERGAQVEEISVADKFTQISSAGKKGFVNQLFLTPDAPSKKDSLLEKDVDISSKARKRASGFTSAAAARGLKEDSDDIFQYLGEEDGARLKEMETLYVDGTTGLAFLEETKVAPIKVPDSSIPIKEVKEETSKPAQEMETIKQGPVEKAKVEKKSKGKSKTKNKTKKKSQKNSQKIIKRGKK